MVGGMTASVLLSLASAVHAAGDRPSLPPGAEYVKRDVTLRAGTTKLPTASPPYRPTGRRVAPASPSSNHSPPPATACASVRAPRRRSASSCTLPVNDPGVSGEHALLQATDKGVRVRDLSSTNGTFVDNRRIDHPNELGTRTRPPSPVAARLISVAAQIARWIDARSERPRQKAEAVPLPVCHRRHPASVGADTLTVQRQSALKKPQLPRAPPLVAQPMLDLRGR